MVKVRKYFYYSFICVLFLIVGGLLNAVSVSIDLSQLEKADDGNGNVLPTAYVNEKFKIKIKISQGSRDTSDVTVDGLDVFQVLKRNQQTSTTILNGAYSSQVTYVYTLVADKTGIYNLGPAYVTDSGKKLQSDVVRFQVLASSPERHARQVQEQKAAGIETPRVLVTLKMSKDRCVVGEQLEAIIHIARSGPVVDVAISSLPQFKGFLTREIEQLTEGTEEIDGVPYKFVEKKYILSPLQVGEKEIGSIQIVYTYRQDKQKRRQGGFFGDDMMNVFFDMHAIRKAMVASNSATVHVDPLPEFRGKVDGVGHFTALTASFDKQEVTQNEPVILKIALTGQANFDQISDVTPSVPDDVKWYKSKAEAKLQSDFGGTKEFEYIVQVPHVGVIEFPQQTFTFFDVIEKKYKKLQTQPLSLMVKPAAEGMMTPSKPEVKKEPSPSDERSEKAPEKSVDIHFIEEDSSVHNRHAQSLPFWLFLIVIMIPLLFSQRARIDQLLRRGIFKRQVHKKSLARCDIDLATLVEQAQAKQLYHFFINFFATKYEVPVSDITEKFIAHKLGIIGLESDKIDEFLAYLNDCAGMYFTSAYTGEEHKNRVIKRAKYWYLLINK